MTFYIEEKKSKNLQIIKPSKRYHKDNWNKNNIKINNQNS